MPPHRIAEDYFSPDIRDFIVALNRHQVRYLIIGGEAVIFYGYARYTGDVDFFYDPAEANARALFAALKEFWGGKVPDMADHTELMDIGMIIQFGRPPNRIDLLNQIDGVAFKEASDSPTQVDLCLGTQTIGLPYLSLQNLIQNKQASGRSKDLDDLRYLTRKEKEDKSPPDQT